MTKPLEFRVNVPVVIDMEHNPTTGEFEPVKGYQRRIADAQTNAKRLVERNRALIEDFLKPREYYLLSGSLVFARDGRPIYSP